MESTRPELARIAMMPDREMDKSSGYFMLAADRPGRRPKVRSRVRFKERLQRYFNGLWHSMVSRVGSKPKRLAVRESAALGDRRFVSVVQFERQRFLIGSSAASVTLLARLPDEVPVGETSGEIYGSEF